MDFHHSRCWMAWIFLNGFFWLAFLIESCDNARTAAYTVVRNPIDRWSYGEIKYNYLIVIAWTLSSDSIAGFFIGEVQTTLSTWIWDACSWIDYKFTGWTWTSGVQTITLTIQPICVTFFTLTCRVLALYTIFGNREQMTGWTWTPCTCNQFYICLKIIFHIEIGGLST